MASQDSNKVFKMDKKTDGGMRLQEVRLTAGPNGQLPDEDDLSFMDDIDRATATLPSFRRNWPLTATQTWFWFRILAGGLFAAFMIAWPVGKALAYRDEFGTLKSWNFFSSYDAAIILYAITVPLLVLIIGYVIAIGMRITSAAEEVSYKANQLIRPETTAVHGVKTVGSAVRGEIDALNNHVDDALARLASVESMIRQQIKAIDTAGTAIETGGSEMTERVSGERRKLMDLTEAMNNEADAFAAAIAEKAKLGIEKTETANARLLGAEQELDTRLGRLETIAEKAYDSFEALSNTLIKQEEMLAAKSAYLDETVEDTAQRSTNTQKALEENTAALASAQSMLQRESEQLEKLILEQRVRAERLAATISGKAEIQTAPLDIPNTPLPSFSQENATPSYFEAPRFDDPISDPMASTAAMNNAKLPATAPIMPVPNKSHDPISALPSTNNAVPTPQLSPQSSPSENPNSSENLTPPSSTDEAPSFEQGSPIPASKKRAWSEILAAAEEPSTEGDFNFIPAATKDTDTLEKPTDEQTDASSTLEDQSTPETELKDQEAPLLEEAEEQAITPTSHDSDASPTDIYASSAASSENDVVNLIRTMQAFTLRMLADLYETPQTAALERFENGERNLFAHLLLRKDEADLKQRIKIETSRDQSFGIALTEFLHNFDQLLEPANESNAADSLLDDYLGSPLGQLYILTGSAVDYFS